MLETAPSFAGRHRWVARYFRPAHLSGEPLAGASGNCRDSPHPKALAIRDGHDLGRHRAFARPSSSAQPWLSGVYRFMAFPGLPPSFPFALEAAFLARLLDWPPI